VVVGSANVDLVWQGPRLPQPGETVTDGTFVQVFGGKGANQAAAAAALGADVLFVGSVGDDERGDAIRSDLEARGVDCSPLAVADEPTGVAVITVDAAGENAIAVAPGANRSVAPEIVERTIRADDVVLCSCEINLDAVRAAINRGTTTIVNPAPAREAFAGAILTPNERECAQLGGVAALLAQAPAVIVTRGRAGADLHRPGLAVYRQPAFSVSVVDTTGAGDAFNGALAWAIAGGRPLDEAVRLACGAGALATRAVGARSSLPSADELYSFVTA
jgi:ribokinase